MRNPDTSVHNALAAGEVHGVEFVEAGQETFFAEAAELLKQSEEHLGFIAADVSGQPDTHHAGASDNHEVKSKTLRALEKLRVGLSACLKGATLAYLLTLSGDYNTASVGSSHKIEDFKNARKERVRQHLPPERIASEQLPDLVAFGNWLLDGAFVREYNKAVDFYNCRENGRMSDAEVRYKETISENICMLDYGDMTAGYFRLRNLEKNERPYSKEKLDAMTDAERIRVDLTRKYLGLTPHYNYLSEATYKPTKAKDEQAKYTSFDSKAIIAELNQGRENHAGQKNDLSFKDLEIFIVTHKKFPLNSYTSQLGVYGAGIAYDEVRHEKYAYYYDLWDINPPYADELGIDFNQFNFPFEIYGRVYESDLKQ